MHIFWNIYYYTKYEGPTQSGIGLSLASGVGMATMLVLLLAGN